MGHPLSGLCAGLSGVSRQVAPSALLNSERLTAGMFEALARAPAEPAVLLPTSAERGA